MPRLLLFCAIMTMAAASVSAASGDAAFWVGLGAYRACDYDAAIQLLGEKTDNPYLETFRLYYRADCLLRDSLYKDAALEIETLFALVDSGAVDQKHRFVDRARDMYVEALASAGTCVIGPPQCFPPCGMKGLSDRAWFLASRACLVAGDTASAMEHLLNGATGNTASEDLPLFKELFHRCEPCLDAWSDGELLGIASHAAYCGLYSEANAAVDLVLARKPDDVDALLGRAHVMFKLGDSEQALRVYWRVFYSDAPVGAKATALQGISSIEYELKHYDKAAKYYFMQGSFYRGAAALDRAARIYAREREWKKAIRAWTVLRERHRGERLDAQVWIEAGLSEAVLRSWLGADAEANAILRDIVPRARGSQCAAVLFWLMKTSSSNAERAVWSDSLLHAWPRSFYASIARGDESPLRSGRSDSDSREIDALARIADDRLARCDTAGSDSAFARHPALRAYVGLLEHGFSEEAKATAQAMFGIQDLLYRERTGGVRKNKEEQSMLEIVPERLFKLYAEASRRGLDALSLTMLSYASPTDSSGTFPADLWYPVSYIDEIRAGAAAAGLPPLLVLAIIREESRFDPEVASRVGAIGLMQLMPETALWHSALKDTLQLGADDLRDPAKNILAGTAYFRYLLNRFDDSVIGALASYNGGEGRMARWKENFEPAINPLVALELIGPRETRLYVKKVLDAHSAYAAMARERAHTE